MSNSENYSDESIYSNGGGSSGDKADSERVEVYYKDMKEILFMMKTFNPYKYESEKEISNRVPRAQRVNFRASFSSLFCFLELAAILL